ncbi:MAG: hypothetical protein JST92_07990, partial [Deltaproteobacteria bacterium]|nr:hypothetical protein [Deltaproteobacteria bacterium]
MRSVLVLGVQVRLAALTHALLLAAPLAAQDAGTPVSPAAVEAPAAAAPSDPRAAEVHALLAGTLEVGVEPRSLFDVPLDDEAAIKVEAARVRALLRAAEEAARPARPRSRRGSK